MKPIKSIVLTLGVAAGTVLFMAGCGKTETTETEPVDHSEHADADGGNAMADMAGKVADAATKLAVVVNPTAEQLDGTKEYPLETCPNSGEKLGEMGDPVLLLIGNQQVKLCCKDCISDVKADPAKFLAKLEK